VHMKPKFEPGDQVSNWECTHQGIIVGVAQSNHLPDAVVRGLQPDTFGWMYYVLFADPLKVTGPMAPYELHGVT
jgi:hypothetical protein